MKRLIVTRGSLALGASAVLLAIAASPAAATRSLNPDSLDFGDQAVGATSAPEDTALEVECNDVVMGSCASVDLFAPSIAISGDFAQTNDCPALIVGNSPPGPRVTCTINVTFTPTATGQRNGILTTGPGGPTASLTGAGVGLILDLKARKQELRKRVAFTASSNADSTLLATGDVKRKATQLAAKKKTKVKAKLKRKVRKRLKKRLKRGKKAKAKVKGTATTAGGQSATDKVKVRLTN